MTPRFYFTTCQIGAEKAAKAEILAEYPDLKFAFSRPGFITFKQDDDSKPAIQENSAIFSRLWGVSISQTKDEKTFAEMMKEIPAGSIVHAFERDTATPGDEAEEFVPNARITAALQKLPAALRKNFKLNEKPKLKETVYDVIWLDDFHVFLGKHTHLGHLDPSPGNLPTIILPPESPSRAYLKIAEAIHRFQPKISQGMQVLEVGCSPGGATTAMISLGLEVTGIDPKFMDKSLENDEYFHFIQKPAKDVSQSELRYTNPDWIVMDMNIAPLEALDQLAHIVGLLKANYPKDLKLKQGFLTIKLNDWKFADSIRLYMKRLHEIGFRDMIPMQLASNKQEFFVMAKDFTMISAPKAKR
jgi:23S rRNA (cytidine2498-2'-O)-methyltransferase